MKDSHPIPAQGSEGGLVLTEAEYNLIMAYRCAPEEMQALLDDVARLKTQVLQNEEAAVLF
ncbi:MAG TPA: hypothetical protein H9714_10295 [Candidatus Flavonifractor intestinipullorum]|uniref:Uncharacterized protein n=1 Tax=Candidatus Flavonifractor intestinipullorum TaxID=2838587 RepID=A0A9D2S5P4_9FIRM|nr:hypothetical protein [Candidatus Flavonifractor intestinipullorum]